MRQLLAIALFALAVPAFALNNRSAVSVNGLDTNPCTVASPCRSFTAAIAQTSADGEVIALDSAGYGPFNVPTSLTISGAPGVHAAITVTSGAAIIVNTTPLDNVTVRNLVLIGAGGTIGIFVPSTSAAELRVLNCTLRGFTGEAIITQNGRLTADHCVILDSSSAVYVNGSITTVQAVITNSLLERFANGVFAIGDASVHITSCTIAGGDVGVGASSTAGTGALRARVFIESSTLTYNSNAIAVAASGGNNSAIVYIAQDDITFSGNGVSASGGGSVMSYGNNRFAEVTTIGPLGSIALQ